MRLGFFPNGSGAYPEIPPAVAMEWLAREGFESIDLQAHAGVRDGLDSDGYSRRDRRLLRAHAARFGLRIAAVVTSPGLLDSARLGRPLDLLSAVRLAQDLGASFVTVHVMSPGAPAVLRRTGREEAIDMVAAAASAAAASGVQILVDALVPDSFIGSPDDVARFLAGVGEPNVGWNADPAFLVVAGFDPCAALREVAPWIRHVHMKGARGQWPDVEWLLPGDGDVDCGATIRTLHSIGYLGAITAEPIARPRMHHGAPRWSFQEALIRSRGALGPALRAYPD